MKFTPISDPIDALLTCLVIAHGLAGLVFIGWLWRKNRQLRHERQALLQRHARIQAHPRGFITPELLQVIAGIALMICLGLGMAACFADDLRW
jgi:hypothetical protein